MYMHRREAVHKSKGCEFERSVRQMKRKLWKNLVGTGLIVSMVLPVIACGDGNAESSTASVSENGNSQETAAFSWPVQDETLSIWTLWESNYLTSMEDIPTFAVMEEETGVHLDITTVSYMEYAEKYSIMLANNDYPDIICDGVGGTSSYPGGIEKAVQDGVYLDLTDLVDQYMPNYKKILEDYPEIKKEDTTDDGRICAIYTIQTDNTGTPTAPPNGAGLAIRQDWLDELNLEVPETIDDWHTVLTAFKNEKNCEAPLMIGSTGTIENGAFITAYGVAPEFYQADGTVKYGPIEDGYKDYLTTMAQWYEEGLIDPNFVANDASSNAPFEYSASDRTGAFSTAYGFMGTAFYSDMHMVDNDQYCLTAVNNPVLNSGDTPECLTLPTISASSYAISTSCDNPELAARWLDYQFSQDAFMLNSFGIEGETYTVGEDGTVTLADSVIHPEQEGISSSDYFATLVPAYNWPGLISMETQEDFVGDELRLEARDVWSSDGTDMVIPSRVSMTSEESSDYMAAYTSIQTYVQEMTTKFIMGTESIDDQWDNYVSTIDSLGIDTCIQYQQAALDRYNER